MSLLTGLRQKLREIDPGSHLLVNLFLWPPTCNPGMWKSCSHKLESMCRSVKRHHNSEQEADGSKVFFCFFLTQSAIKYLRFHWARLVFTGDTLDMLCVGQHVVNHCETWGLSSPPNHSDLKFRPKSLPQESSEIIPSVFLSCFPSAPANTCITELNGPEQGDSEPILPTNGAKFRAGNREREKLRRSRFWIPLHAGVLLFA